MAVVYRHIRKDKGVVFYIGYATDRQSHYRPFTYDGRNKIWNNISKKTDIVFEILLNNLSDRDALAWEKYLVGLYGKIKDKTGTLANLTDGGEGANGLVHSDESRRKMSEAKKKLLSDKTKHPLYGRTGESHPHYGRKRSDEFRKNQSKDKIGEKNPMYGRRGSNCPNSKRVTNGLKEWGSLKEAAADLGCPYSSAMKMILGIRTNKYNLRYL